MAEVSVETRNTEPRDDRKQANQVAERHDGQVERNVNHNDDIVSDETHGRCYSCCLSCKACCKPCMTEHNPLPDNPSRFDIVDFYLQLHHLLQCTAFYDSAVESSSVSVLVWA